MNNATFPVTQPYIIAIEGIDGAGKSTLAQELCTRSTSSCLVSRLDRKSIELFQELSEDLHNKTLYQDVIPDEFRHLCFLVEAVGQLARMMRSPEASCIIFDRWTQTWGAYCGPLDHYAVWGNRMFSLLPAPAVTFYLRVSPETALRRMTERAGFERWFIAYDRDFILERLHRVVASYEELILRENVVVLDGEGSREEVLEQALSALGPMGLPFESGISLAGEHDYHD